MQSFVMNKIEKQIKKIKSEKKMIPKVLICGLTYKKNVSDIRNSLSLKIFLDLRKSIKIFLVMITCVRIKFCQNSRLKKIEKIKHKFDIIVFLVGHKKNKPLHDYFRKQKKNIIDPFKLYD